MGRAEAGQVAGGGPQGPGAAPGEIGPWLAETARWVEAGLGEFLAGAPGGNDGQGNGGQGNGELGNGELDGESALWAAMGHALLGGGKRLRPALVRAVCVQLGGSDQEALAPACAIEMVHAYSLVHDDLPCMDDDELRRGRPSCHVVYGEALAVLAGDGLLTRALGLLADSGGPRAALQVASLARAAGERGMVLGQALDLAQEGRAATPEGVQRIHALKTGALLAAAVELGARAAGGDPRPLAPFGEALGLLFQAVDDVLDVTGEAAELGKTPGKDAAANKATLVAAMGLEGARERAAELAERALAAGADLGWAPEDRPLALVRALRDRKK